MPAFVDFKRVVWHESFEPILQWFMAMSKIGHHFLCGDAIERWLFPLLLILAADLEEQYALFLDLDLGDCS